MQFEYSLSEIDETAKKILAVSKPIIFLFYGSMGVGKTTLIKAFAKQLGVGDQVSSPTFSLVNEYRDADDNPIFHFDFYRIEQEEEALDMGVEEYFDSNAYCLIEWPENIKNLLPLETVSVNITEQENGKRTIILENYEQ
ncbi:MAG TPA: tRNA (adenosine(37)-N6)-threonylcarbamoyltransferase complex ATPase subunit type 1 TsaE [Lutibacter sp.]|nr:tRNA (adenosine(37)-N6)-threonylcarbamoyltransferase complex ATPase subunit type 1 TsaE [Lutibacter sp.]